MTDDQHDIAIECDALKAFLLAKNASYGSSFASPMGVFAKGISPDVAVRIRLDDKLARLAKGDPSFGNEDIFADILGYLVLLRVLRRRAMATEARDRLRNDAVDDARSDGFRRVRERLADLPKPETPAVSLIDKCRAYEAIRKGARDVDYVAGIACMSLDDARRALEALVEGGALERAGVPGAYRPTKNDPGWQETHPVLEPAENGRLVPRKAPPVEETKAAMRENAAIRERVTGKPAESVDGAGRESDR